MCIRDRCGPELPALTDEPTTHCNGSRPQYPRACFVEGHFRNQWRQLRGGPCGTVQLRLGKDERCLAHKTVLLDDVDARQVVDVRRESDALCALAGRLLDKVFSQRLAGTVSLRGSVCADPLKPHVTRGQIDRKRERDDGSVQVGDRHLGTPHAEPFVDDLWHVVVSFPYLRTDRQYARSIGEPCCTNGDSHVFLLSLSSDGRLRCPVRSIHVCAKGFNMCLTSSKVIASYCAL